jgi:diguanylate cyclase (GGDEF)-like protein/PAS domain S-box-containing protein
LKRREALLAQAARMSRIGGWELDLNSGSFNLSEEGRKICGIADGETVTKQAFLDRFQNDEDRARMRLALSNAGTRGKPFDFEAEIADGSGTRWLRTLAEPESVNGRVVRVMGAVQDITERKEAAAQIEHLAYRDPLTGLPNRTQFHERLQRAMSSAKSTDSRYGLLLFDIDHFKSVNDSMGHYAGDAVLSVLAARLQPAMAPGHTLARIAGDEFAIIIPDIHGPDDLLPTANAVIELLKQPIAHDGYALALGVSIGGAIFPDNGHSGSEILKNADIALCRAKAEGRGRFVMFQDAMRADIEARVQLLHDVRAGIAGGNFSLLYQPIVSTHTGTVNSFEGLMRWSDSERGILSPATFMAAFDDPDLAILLGDAALNHATRQMRQWLDTGIEFGRVAVNLSAPQFRLRGLADRILGMMRQHQIPNRYLSLEITESVYIDACADDVLGTIHALHDAGISIALDDFGTGYASLSHLCRLPIDRLKIDKSFVQLEARSAIVDAIIHMGRGLGIDVVAEGVETREQVAALRAKGCDHMQGFIFGRPLAAYAVPEFIHQVGTYGLTTGNYAA